MDATVRLVGKRLRPPTKALRPQESAIRPMQNKSSQSIFYPMNTPAITIRPAYADDQLALERLAALDSAKQPPPRPLLLAEFDGDLRVALSLRDGSAIADPFFPTAAVLQMLRAHVRANKRSRRSSLAAWLRPVAVAWARPATMGRG